MPPGWEHLVTVNKVWYSCSAKFVLHLMSWQTKAPRCRISGHEQETGLNPRAESAVVFSAIINQNDIGKTANMSFFETND